jgi:hypothetical protein
MAWTGTTLPLWQTKKAVLYLDVVSITVKCFSYKENKLVCAPSSG